MKLESSLLTTIVLYLSASALGQSAAANPQYASGYEILTKNPKGQFQPYVNRLLQAVREQWYPLILESTASSNQDLGATVIELVVGKDGSLDEMKFIESSRNASLDEAGSNAIRSATPFPRIPLRFQLESMRLRFHFEYRQANGERPACDPLGSGVYSGVYSKDGEIKPPHALSDPNPEYSEEARKIKYQGFVTLRTTVGIDSVPSDICIEQALGRGLDEKAVSALKTWKFEPATKNGTPVPAALHVEMTFNLY